MSAPFEKFEVKKWNSASRGLFLVHVWFENHAVGHAAGEMTRSEKNKAQMQFIEAAIHEKLERAGADFSGSTRAAKDGDAT